MWLVCKAMRMCESSPGEGVQVKKGKAMEMKPSIGEVRRFPFPSPSLHGLLSTGDILLASFGWFYRRKWVSWKERLLDFIWGWSHHWACIAFMQG